MRVPDLHAFRHAIAGLAQEGDTNHLRSRVVLVPTAGAARQLRRTLGEDRALKLLTREEFYSLLHARLGERTPRLTTYDRDVMVQSAAREAAARLGLAGQWRLRPGLLAEILRFYDQLRRQARNIARFEELLEEVLSRDAEHDRGAERMLAETRFLVATFRGYEERVRTSGACDEHVLRERLLVEVPSAAVHDVIVTIGDWIADPNGLYLADFDFLTRLPGLETIDVVATEGLLQSGFHQRVHEWLPGIEEVEASTLRLGALATVRPTLATVRPTLGIPSSDPERLVFVHRDREEELIAIARRVLTSADRAALDRVAIVYKRPLPYLYLAREVFGGSGILYQTFDALPLAAEPPAAALDLVFAFVESSFTRSSLVALLRSPHFAFGQNGRSIDRDAVSALDRVLSDKRYLGGLDRLAELSATWSEEGDEGARGALHLALAAAERLAPLLAPAPASTQCRRLIEFLDAYEVRAESDPQRSAQLGRAQAAVRDTLESLIIAHQAYDDAPIAVAELSTSVRRWIEEHTWEWAPAAGDAGLQLVDDQTARYGAFDELAVVGLVEGDWPERPKRNIFYPSSLLTSLGWPTEQDRRGAAEVRFLELLGSASRLVTISTVSLDDESLVEPSTFADEISRAGLSTMPLAVGAGALREDALFVDPVSLDTVDSNTREWAGIRLARSSREAAIFHGQAGSLPRKAWSVSALETYLGCPFKFFAQHVLKLQEEPDDEEVMDPRSQGQFIHDVFEAFFTRWQRDGHQAITPDTIEMARLIFREVVEDCLGSLSDTEAALERTRLLGSPAAAGLGEAVFHMEAERAVPVVARLLEHRLKDEFVFNVASGQRTLSISGKADRIDLLADGTFRLIDYKLGWPPNKARALQLPIYGVCAEQRLTGYLGRSWTLGEAAYLAFKGPKRVVGLFSSGEDRHALLSEAQERLVATVDAIEAGQFPPTPDDVHRCETCTFTAVCRKDYVGDV